MSSSFTKLRQKSEFFDVTLSCDHGKSEIQAHKVILAACSPFFHRVLARNPHQNPLIYLKGVDYENLEAVINFMYQGEVNVAQEDLNGFLGVAQELAVKGLTDGNKNSNGNGSGDKQPVKKVVKKPMPASAAASGAMKRPPPQLQPAPNLAATQAPTTAVSPVPGMPSAAPSASALMNSSSSNSPNVAKKPKLSPEERLHVVKPDIENNLEENEHSPEEMEEYGVYGEGYDGAYLDDSMAADEMEMGMGPGLDGDGAKGKLDTTLNFTRSGGFVAHRNYAHHAFISSFCLSLSCGFLFGDLKVQLSLSLELTPASPARNRLLGPFVDMIDLNNRLIS